jgi:hypothetical protein
MPFLQKSKYVSAPIAYYLWSKQTVQIEYSFFSSSDPLLLRLLRCSLSVIDGLCDPLCSRSSSIGCSSMFLFDAHVSTSPYIVFKFVGVSLPSTHVCSFFLSSLRRLYLGLLKLVPLFFSSQRASIHMTNHRHPVKVGNWIPLLKRVGLGDPNGRLLSWLRSPWTKISVQLVMISVFHLMNLQILSVPILASDDMFFNIVTADIVLKRKDGDKF